MSKLTPKPEDLGERTRLVHAGRDPNEQHGFVNTPIYRGSTVLFPTTDDLLKRRGRFTYGTHGTPTTESLETAWTQVAGAAGTVLAPSGLAAVTLGAHRVPQGRRPSADDQFRLPPDASFLRWRAEKIWCGNHLLRSADRCRHRRSVAPQHNSCLYGSARIPILRDAGYSCYRRGRAPSWRGCRHGQHVGDAAVFRTPPKGRRRGDRGGHEVSQRRLGPAPRAGVSQ